MGFWNNDKALVISAVVAIIAMYFWFAASPNIDIEKLKEINPVVLAGFTGLFGLVTGYAIGELKNTLKK